MELVKLPGMNRTLGAPKGWDKEKHGTCAGLPVYAEVVNGQMVMTSAWKPNAEELVALQNGGCVAMVIYGGLHPPIALGVFPPQPYLVVAEVIDVERPPAVPQTHYEGVEVPAALQDQWPASPIDRVRNDAFNLCDTVQEHFNVGNVQAARDAIMKYALSVEQGDGSLPAG